MPDIFGEDIAGKIYQGLKGKVFDITLTKVEPGTRTPGSLTGGTNPVETAHTVKGFVDHYQDRHIDGTLIQRGDRKIIILGGSLPSGVVPEPSDKLTAEGETRAIVEDGVTRDPAGATYTCQVR
jgi:fructose-1-phosphate kinase PfkB-like protein